MAEYRSMEQIRAEADTEYHVYWQDDQETFHMENIIADDHEDALNQVTSRKACAVVLLVLKGDFLILWQA